LEAFGQPFILSTFQKLEGSKSFSQRLKLLPKLPCSPIFPNLNYWFHCLSFLSQFSGGASGILVLNQAAAAISHNGCWPQKMKKTQYGPPYFSILYTTHFVRGHGLLWGWLPL